MKLNGLSFGRSIALTLILLHLNLLADWQELPEAGFSTDSKEYAIQIEVQPNSNILFAAGPVNSLGNDLLELAVKKFENNQWTQVGEVFIGVEAYQSLKLVFDPILGTPYITYLVDNDIQDKTDGFVVYKLSGNTWVQVGSTLNVQEKSHPDIAIQPVSGIPYIAVKEYVELPTTLHKVYKLESNQWLQVSNELGKAKEQYIGDKASIAFHPVTGEPYVAFADAGEWDAVTLRVRRFDGNIWWQVGEAIGNITNYYLQQDVPWYVTTGFEMKFHPNTHEPYLFYEEHDKGAALKKFNGQNWEFISQDIALPSFGKYLDRPSMQFDPSSNVPYLAALNGTQEDNQGYQVKYFSNGSAKPVGGINGIGERAGQNGSIDLAFHPVDNLPFIAFYDEGVAPDHLGKGFKIMKLKCLQIECWIQSERPNPNVQPDVIDQIVQVELTPNPTTNTLYINGLNPDQQVIVVIVDVTNNHQVSITSTGNLMENDGIAIEDLPEGLYVAQVYSKKGEILLSERFVKE